jgi:hypothetical protein
MCAGAGKVPSVQLEVTGGQQQQGQQRRPSAVHVSTCGFCLQQKLVIRISKRTISRDHAWRCLSCLSRHATTLALAANGSTDGRFRANCGVHLAPLRGVSISYFFGEGSWTTRTRSHLGSRSFFCSPV